jgi:starch synthase
VQKQYGLFADAEATLVAFVGRLAEQKGIQLLSARCSSGVSVLEELLTRYPGVQVFIGGPPTQGDPTYIALMVEIQRLGILFPGRIAGVSDFIEHRGALEITKAADLFLMPSRYEPGGITQLEALAAGTLVVARNVGGIAATLVDFTSATQSGNSFLFDDYTPDALFRAIGRGVDVVSDDSKRMRLIERAAQAENDWSDRVPKYVALLQFISGALSRRQGFSHLAKRDDALRSIRPAIIPSSF